VKPERSFVLIPAASIMTRLLHLSSGRIPYERIITDTAPLRNTPEAFRKLAAGDANLKVAILPD
jgi:hypothetical protein